jgi:nucleotide-binding universal stress UspA family protein
LHVVIAAESALPGDPEVIPDVEAVEATAQRRLESLERWILDVAVANGIGAEVHVLPRPSVHSVMNFAREQGIDLLVFSESKHLNLIEAAYSELQDALLGSRAGKIINRAPCSVMIVK